MPKRTDISKILIIGSGPIVIGQACEFDYSGAQACKALREEGYEVVLVNSNPATIMTDPEMADATYVEPITPKVVEEIIKKERPDALLPTMGGQTGLNTAVALAESGALDALGVELIGAKLPAIRCAEDRDLFKRAMREIGLDLPRSQVVTTMARAGRRRAASASRSSCAPPSRWADRAGPWRFVRRSSRRNSPGRSPKARWIRCCWKKASWAGRNSSLK